MRRIFTIGESVLDIVFRDNIPETSTPGGSSLNTSISLSRLNLPVNFISEIGNDLTGNLISDFLVDNNLNIDYLLRNDTGQTSIALAFLNNKNDANYSFYRNFPEKRFQFEPPEINENDILLFSSSFAINASVRPFLIKLLKIAKEKNCIIIYDPNFRESYKNNLKNLMPLILENISYADIVRGSHEDFYNIFGSENSKNTYSKIMENGCNILVYTDSEKGVNVNTGYFISEYILPKINPISTIGAGDNFNAGIIYSVYTNKLAKQDLFDGGEEVWNKIINSGICLATAVCLSNENYVSKDFDINKLSITSF